MTKPDFVQIGNKIQWMKSAYGDIYELRYTVR